MTAMRPETTSEHIARDMREGRFPERSEPQMVADLAAVQPAQVRVKPWSYCPECGCEEPRYGEGPHKQCARCYQEWFTDVDYSGVVRGNLERLFIAAIEPQPDPRDAVIAALVEALRLMRSTYPYNPPCYGWVEQVEAHKTAKAALAAAKEVQHG